MSSAGVASPQDASSRHVERCRAIPHDESTSCLGRLRSDLIGPAELVVYLNRIYTRGGDSGETSLGNMSRVPKTHPRIVAYGTVDELNSVVGVARATPTPAKFDPWLAQIQNDLFDLGADLCVPHADPPPPQPPLRVVPEQVSRLETWIDEVNEQLMPLTSFILPGGSRAAAALHHCRTVCRRAEIEVLRLKAVEPVTDHAAIYLNRLSDLFFVLARASHDHGQGDVLWQPGGVRA